MPHMKLVIKIKEGCEERDVWPIRNRILDLDRAGTNGLTSKIESSSGVEPKETAVCD